MFLVTQFSHQRILEFLLSFPFPFRVYVNAVGLCLPGLHLQLDSLSVP